MIRNYADEDVSRRDKLRLGGRIMASCLVVILIVLAGCSSMGYGRSSAESSDAGTTIEHINDKATLLDITRNHANKNMRLLAAQKLDDQAVYEKIAKNDKEEYEVRHYIIQRLTNQTVFAEIAKKNRDWRLREIATGRLNNLTLLAQIAKDDENQTVRRRAADRSGQIRSEEIEKINDQALLEKYAQHDESHWVRVSAVRKLNDQNLLTEIAKNDESVLVRKIAISKIDDPATLVEIARTEEAGWARQEVVEKLTDQKFLTEIATGEKFDPYDRQEATKKLTSQSVLKKIATSENPGHLRKVAVERLDDQTLIAKIAKSDRDGQVRSTAIGQLASQALLAGFAKNDENEGVRQAAVSKLNDQKLIAKIAKEDKSGKVRQAAAHKLEDQALLAEISKKDESGGVRIAAKERLDALNKSDAPWSWERFYFKPIHELSEKVNWPLLCDADIPKGSLEVRVWIGFGLGALEGLRLCRNGGEWTGFYTSENYFWVQHFYTDQDAFNQLNDKQKEHYELAYKELKPMYELKPQTNWANLWKKVEALGILTLPDSSTLPNKVGIRDGVGYVVEVNDGGRYRVYHYSNPQSQVWSEAEKIIEIIKTFDTEFKHVLPTNRMSWGYWK